MTADAASSRAGMRSAQSLSIAVPRTHSTLGNRQPRFLRRSASSLEQPSTAHPPWTSSQRTWNLFFFSRAFCCILSVFMFFIHLFGALVMFLSHLRRLNLDLVDWLTDWLTYLLTYWLIDWLQWDELMQHGDVDDDDLEQQLQRRIDAQTPNRCCMLIYTVSGLQYNNDSSIFCHLNRASVFQ